MFANKLVPGPPALFFALVDTCYCDRRRGHGANSGGLQELTDTLGAFWQIVFVKLQNCLIHS